jgi:4-hydroxy-tetrahydrodipicolinate synthase
MNEVDMFKGVYTAIITPFRNGKIDFDAFARHIESQIKDGIDGIVPMGTTGESPTVSHEDHLELIKKSVEFANKRIKVVAGTGSNSTQEAVYMSEKAAKFGVDAVLLVNPYYNKPTQKGMIAHFDAATKAAGIPSMLYNMPGRTSVNFLPESVAELVAKNPLVKGMKEASGDITQMMRLIELCGDKIDVMSGDDNLLLPLLSVGGKGVVSVLSNILPKEVKTVVNLYNEGKTAEARDAFYKILPLCRSVFVETNPIPIKWVMARAGFCSDEIRPPLTVLSDQYHEPVRAAFAKCGVKL